MSNVESGGILQVLSSAIEQVAARVSPSVVSVSSGRGRMGSGIVWDEQGHIVTAYHVVRGLSTVEIGTDAGQSFQASVVGRDPRSDLALLKVEAKLTPIAKGNADALKIGQFVLALANPFSAKASATSGIITGSKRTFGGWWGLSLDEAIVTDARLNPGYSGGPLVNASGEMIGLNIAAVSSRGIAVPIQSITKSVDRLASGKGLTRAYLGIISNTVELPQALAQEAQVGGGGGGQNTGLMILSVELGSPAKNAGLAMGDVLVKFGGKPINGLHDLGRLLTEEAIGKETKLEILRGEKPVELTITPGSADEGEE